MDRFRLEIVTPEGRLFDRSSSSVEIPGVEGRFAVLKGHMNLIASVEPGIVKICESELLSESFVVFDGTVEVNGSNCAILVEKAINVTDIEVAKVEKALQKAEQDLAKADSETMKAFMAKEVEYLNQQLLACK